MKKIFTWAAICLSFLASAQSKMDFEKYNPVSTLVVPGKQVTHAKFPFIDVHNHQWNMASQSIPELLKEMDQLNMKIMVNLSGKSGQDLMNGIKHVKETTPNRVLQFANISFTGFGETKWTENTVKQLEQDVKAGANGLKIFKTLGLESKDKNGKLVAVDDPRLDAVWEKCGELHIPVLIHTADPKPFWDVADDKNERWLEIISHPGRGYYGLPVPSFETLIQQQHNIIRKHPRTLFIVAHFGWYANDLGKLGSLLDSFPNMNIEFGAIIAELGRQPRMAKKFFEKYQDRILFGKDSWVPAEYATYFRVLETEDEYFPYHKKYHAFWAMYGMGLSDDVLKKVYYKNALRIIPNIDKTLFPN
ncbi:MAG: amidohydrolase family protein [Bacteroidota bacterium]